MASWQGVNYEQIPPADNPKEANTQQRRADLYRRIKELGHPALFDVDDKEHFARKYDISFRQVYNDLDAIAQFVRETVNEDEHVTDAMFVFEKAVSEAIADGEWEEAADILMQQSEWLERRGVIDNEDVTEVEVEHEWRTFIEKAVEDNEAEDIEVEAF